MKTDTRSASKTSLPRSRRDALKAAGIMGASVVMPAFVAGKASAQKAETQRISRSFRTFNRCTDEYIQLTGTIHVTSRYVEVDDNSGTGYRTISKIVHKYSGVGETSGKGYQFIQQDSSSLTQRWDQGATEASTHTVIFKVISQGSDEDLAFRMVSHLTQNANQEWVADQYNYEWTCN